MARGRRPWIWAGVGVGTLMVISSVVILAFRDRATPIDADDVVATMTIIPGGDAPGDNGLYTYQTAGFETTDALGGARHDYPAETFATLQPGGCGTLVRWQALEQRWTEWEYCEGWLLAGWDSYHQWYGVSNLDEWTCPDPVPTTGEPGASWSVECFREGASEIVRYDVVGVEEIEVGGETVATLHVRTTSSSTGETRSEGVTDIWTLADSPLVVQRIVSYTSVSDSRIGDVEYHEEYQIRLVSLRPSS